MGLTVVGYVLVNGKERRLSLAECAAIELSQSPSRRKSAGLVTYTVTEKTSKTLEVAQKGVYTRGE
jgi:hypothetical protein